MREAVVGGLGAMEEANAAISEYRGSTLLKKKNNRDAGAQHVGTGKLRRPRRSSGPDLCG
jgi:hypothetical protein